MTCKDLLKVIHHCEFVRVEERTKFGSSVIAKGYAVYMNFDEFDNYKVELIDTVCDEETGLPCISILVHL